MVFTRWGKSARREGYGWRVLPGDTDLDFCIDFICPVDARFKAFASLPVMAALAGAGKRLLVLDEGVTREGRRVRVVLGGSDQQRLLDHPIGNWLLARQAVVQWRPGHEPG